MSSTPGYLDSMDIANRALFHVGAPKIIDIDEVSESNDKCSFVYDKLRRAELRRNVWKFSTRRAVLRPIQTTTRFLVPNLYDETITYRIGALCRDANGVIWQSVIPDNTNNEPHTTTAWEQYFGPLTISLWDEQDQYSSGELVYKAGSADGSYIIYMSLQDVNEDDPAVAEDFDATVTYHVDEVVLDGGFMWRSLIEFNVGNTPAVAPNDWDENASYSSGNQVTGSDGYIYTSAQNGNEGNDPTEDDGTNWTATGVPRAWSKTPENEEAAKTWLPIFGAGTSFHFRYPVGTGPVSHQTNRNVYRLPAGFLRLAPQYPKAGVLSFAGGPGGMPHNDWEFEGDYLITGEVQPILFRFVADMTDVSKFDDMFCEGLACRIALAVCEPLTQSVQKHEKIASEYKFFMREARMVNAVETGPEEPPEDEFLTCRR